MANTKSKSKTNQKKKGILSKLNLNSTKSRIIVTLLVFGVIGGGFTVYKSFAATNQLFGFLVASDSRVTRSPSVRSIKDSKKNNNYVLSVPTYNQIEFKGLDTENAACNAGGCYDHSTYNGRLYRYCFTARISDGYTSGTTLQSVVTVRRDHSATPNTSLSPKNHTVSYRSNKEYASYCTNQFNGNDYQAGLWGNAGHTGTANIKITNTGSRPVNIGFLVLHECKDAAC